MAEEIMPSNTPFGIEAYRALWAETVASVLSQFTGATLTGEVGAPPAEASREGRWVTFTVTGALVGEQSFQISPADALQLGQTFMAEPLAPEAEFNADHLDSLSELIRQFAGAMSSHLKGVLGSDCSFQFRDTEAPPSLENWQPVCLRVSTSPALTMIAWSDQVLLDALAKKAAQPAEKETTAANAADSAHEKEAAAAYLNGKNLDLLLDLELDVSIRFGKRLMALKDVLELSAGSVVELDRRTQDPIELILGGRVIARGEAVVIDGNYGIRIFEVLSPAQRLAQLA
jgi:flagellar motor switch protein FliN/FliY